MFSETNQNYLLVLESYKAYSRNCVEKKWREHKRVLPGLLGCGVYTSSETKELAGSICSNVSQSEEAEVQVSERK